MKRILIGLIVLFPLIVSAADKVKAKAPAKNSAQQVKAEEVVEIDRVAAIVNDQVITESKLNREMETLYSQLMRMHRKLPTEDVLRKTVLKGLIDKELQLQLAKRNNTQVTDEELGNAINHIKQQNDISDAQLREEIDHQGLTYEQFEGQLRETILIQKIQDMAVRSQITVSDKEIDEFMTKQSDEYLGRQEFHLSHILIPLPDEPTSDQLQAAKLRAQQVYRKLLNGADFAKVASENSSKDAIDGGDLGWRKFAEIPSIFASQVKHMKANDVAGPIKAPNGFHIIKLQGIKMSGKQLTKKDIHNIIYNQKMTEKVQAWITKIRGTAYIKTLS